MVKKEYSVTCVVWFWTKGDYWRADWKIVGMKAGVSGVSVSQWAVYIWSKLQLNGWYRDVPFQRLTIGIPGMVGAQVLPSVRSDKFNCGYWIVIKIGKSVQSMLDDMAGAGNLWEVIHLTGEDGYIVCSNLMQFGGHNDPAGI